MGEMLHSMPSTTETPLTAAETFLAGQVGTFDESDPGEREAAEALLAEIYDAYLMESGDPAIARERLLKDIVANMDGEQLRGLERQHEELTKHLQNSNELAQTRQALAN